MKIRVLLIMLLTLVFASQLAAQDSLKTLDESFLSWDSDRIKEIGKQWRVSGRVGRFFNTRIISTNRAINYSVRATLFSPEMIRASALNFGRTEYLTKSEIAQFVVDSENEPRIVALIEINPNEGSGVIPNSWRASLKRVGDTSNEGEGIIIRAKKNQALREKPAFKGVFGRNYEYDVFWVEFPLKDEKGNAVWDSIPEELELTVGIYNNEERIKWKVSDAFRERIDSILKK